MKVIQWRWAFVQKFPIQFFFLGIMLLLNLEIWPKFNNHGLLKQFVSATPLKPLNRISWYFVVMKDILWRFACLQEILIQFLFLLNYTQMWTYFLYLYNEQFILIFHHTFQTFSLGRWISWVLQTCPQSQIDRFLLHPHRYHSGKHRP